MRNLCLVTLACLLTVIVVPVANAQSQDDIEESISGIVKFFGSTMGAGLYHTAAIHGPLGLCLGVDGAVAVVPDKFKDIPGINENITLGYIHANLGIGANVELTGRMLVLFDLSGEIDDPSPGVSASSGSGRLFSVGLKYGIFQAPALPKLALQATGHLVTLPDEFDYGTVRGLSLKLIASQSIGIMGLYVGGGIDHSRVKIDDSFPLPDLAGKKFNETGFLFNFGAEVNVFPLVTANIGLNFGEYNSYDLGLDIGLR